MGRGSGNEQLDFAAPQSRQLLYGARIAAPEPEPPTTIDPLLKRAARLSKAGVEITLGPRSFELERNDEEGRARLIFSKHDDSFGLTLVQPDGDSAISSLDRREFELLAGSGKPWYGWQAAGKKSRLDVRHSLGWWEFEFELRMANGEVKETYAAIRDEEFELWQNWLRVVCKEQA